MVVGDSKCKAGLCYLLPLGILQRIRMRKLIYMNAARGGVIRVPAD